MQEIIIKDRPFGVRAEANIPRAPWTDGRTSAEAVPDTAADAFYFRALEERGIRLNESQIQAVRHGDGPLLTLAGAGSGKTSVLVSRTGYLIAVRKVAPRNILLVTFTSKAAAEMKSRIARLPRLTPRAASEVQARTFHAFFLMILKHHGYTQRLLSETRYQQIVMKRILRELGLHQSYEPETVLALLSSYKMKCVALDELPEQTLEERDLKAAMLSYEAWKKETHQMDFDDVLVFAHQLLLSNASLLASLQRRFQYVMADEFQDTNHLQYVLLRMIVAGNRNLMVVGDDDQTIYTFNGAQHTFILNFHLEYPETKTITLDINYRSNANIVGLGNAVIVHNKERKAKTLKVSGEQHKASQDVDFRPQYLRPGGTDEEAELIVRHIREQVESEQFDYKEIAILHRTASSSRAMFEQLVLSEMPFVQYGAGPFFYDQWLVKPVMDHLRLALNPRDMDALEHAIAALYVSREAGMTYIRQQDKQHPKKYPLIHLQDWPELKSYQRDAVKERIRLIKSLKAMKPIFAIQEMRRQFYEKYVEVHDVHKWTQHKETLTETLDELESAAKRFETVEAFIAFVDDMAVRHTEMTQFMHDKDADAITLMTIHRSKGLEFPCVYLIGASEGILPHSSALQEAEEAKGDAKRGERAMRRMKLRAERQSKSQGAETGVLAARSEIAAAASEAAGGLSTAAAALEEERRLAYVAVTRAQEELYISSPAHYRGKKADVSRFFAAAFGGAVPERRPAAPLARTAPAREGGARTAAAPLAGAAVRRVRAWLCTDAGCPAWMRMNPREAADPSAASKACPLCKSPMAPGERQVPARD
ncbi:UvrD-helicase domain-containing protein [Paenibacillus guangzhouensis]|uniref:UvrD-helicase domain-containing protein n=1 Tax=Paenibacillus guangzhouensis TaxID=1473112 RepID=UPI00126732BB|nr:UvrD-helicase domain-containing protein [Paenibacillus guangzhouensis]